MMWLCSIDSQHALRRFTAEISVSSAKSEIGKRWNIPLRLGVKHLPPAEKFMEIEGLTERWVNTFGPRLHSVMTVLLCWVKVKKKRQFTSPSTHFLHTVLLIFFHFLCFLVNKLNCVVDWRLDLTAWETTRVFHSFLKKEVEDFNRYRRFSILWLFHIRVFYVCLLKIWQYRMPYRFLSWQNTDFFSVPYLFCSELKYFSLQYF